MLVRLTAIHMPFTHPPIHDGFSPAEAFLWMPFPSSGSANNQHLKMKQSSTSQRAVNISICWFCTSEGSASFSWKDGVLKGPDSCEYWIGEAKGGGIAIFCYPTNTLVLSNVFITQSQA
jgi:hypothetical protein